MSKKNEKARAWLFEQLADGSSFGQLLERRVTKEQGRFRIFVGDGIESSDREFGEGIEGESEGAELFFNALRNLDEDDSLCLLVDDDLHGPSEHLQHGLLTCPDESRVGWREIAELDGGVELQRFFHGHSTCYPLVGAVIPQPDDFVQIDGRFTEESLPQIVALAPAIFANAFDDQGYVLWLPDRL